MGAGATLWAVASGAAFAARLYPSFAPPARWIALGAAFWMAVFAYLRRGGEAESGPRFVAGLALAGASAHLGWALLHLDDVMAHPRVLLNPAAGHSVLFAPLGILASAPRGSTARQRYLAVALGSLPQAFAVARLGCLAGGCCRGVGGFPGADATPICEIAGLLALARWTRRLRAAWVGPATLFGFGTLRLMTEPFRAPSALGEPLIAPPVLATGWVAIGAAMAVGCLRRRRTVGELW
jgi:hypothetical protein